MKRVFAFIQARMSSKRLPGKVLMKINGKTIIGHIVLKLKKIRNLNKVIIVTSIDKTDDVIDEYCKKKNIEVFRGDLDNVYKRYYDAIKYYDINSILRITCDSPLISEDMVNDGINIFKKNQFDIVSNTLLRSYPKGQSFEIFKSSIILNNFKNIKIQSEKEHLTGFFYKNKNKFKIFNKLNKEKIISKNLSIDTMKDFKFISDNFNKLSKIKYI